MKVTQGLLKECFTYKDTGILEYIGYAKYINKPLEKCTIHHTGYKTAYLFGQNNQVHRLIWIWHNKMLEEVEGYAELFAI